MSNRSEMELFVDCHGATEVNLVTSLGFYRDKLHTITGMSREGTLENEMNLKHTEGYHKTIGSK